MHPFNSFRCCDNSGILLICAVSLYLSCRHRIGTAGFAQDMNDRIKKTLHIEKEIECVAEKYKKMYLDKSFLHMMSHMFRLPSV